MSSATAVKFSRVVTLRVYGVQTDRPDTSGRVRRERLQDWHRQQNRAGAGAQRGRKNRGPGDQPDGGGLQINAIDPRRREVNAAVAPC